ncbi:MAG: ATPase [Alphaproteobacteria bacterium]|nr:ATPase [Alphaproteobacteria bacterium]
MIGLPVAAQAAGMPQFDVKSFPSQVFWLVVCFAVLYVLMAKLVLPRIGRTIESRESKIQSDLDAAQKANDAARAAAAGQDKALAEARGQAAGLTRAASEAAAAQTSAKLHEVADRLGADIVAAERRIGEQRSQTLAGLGSMSTEIASAVLGKLVGSADLAQVARAVDEAAKAGKP